MTHHFKYNCDCPTCRLRLEREFWAIADNIFTQAERTGIAESVMRDFSTKTVQNFAEGT